MEAKGKKINIGELLNNSSLFQSVVKEKETLENMDQNIKDSKETLDDMGETKPLLRSVKESAKNIEETLSAEALTSEKIVKSIGESKKPLENISKEIQETSKTKVTQDKKLVDEIKKNGEVDKKSKEYQQKYYEENKEQILAKQKEKRERQKLQDEKMEEVLEAVKEPLKPDTESLEKLDAIIDSTTDLKDSNEKISDTIGEQLELDKTTLKAEKEEKISNQDEKDLELETFKNEISENNKNLFNELKEKFDSQTSGENKVDLKNSEKDILSKKNDLAEKKRSGLLRDGLGKTVLQLGLKTFGSSQMKQELKEAELQREIDINELEKEIEEATKKQEMLLAINKGEGEKTLERITQKEQDIAEQTLNERREFENKKADKENVENQNKLANLENDVNPLVENTIKTFGSSQMKQEVDVNQLERETEKTELEAKLETPEKETTQDKIKEQKLKEQEVKTSEEQLNLTRENTEANEEVADDLDDIKVLEDKSLETEEKIYHELKAERMDNLQGGSDFNLDDIMDNDKDSKDKNNKKSKSGNSKSGKSKRTKPSKGGNKGGDLKAIKDVGSKAFSMAKTGATAIAGTVSSMAGGVASTASAVASGGLAAGGEAAMAALATNPVGWAIAGALAVGAASYGVYHLMIDDDSEEIFDALEDKGIVEHNFFGDSIINDWKVIYVLEPKQIDALTRYDDWTDETMNTLTILQKVPQNLREFLAGEVGQGTLNFNANGIIGISNAEKFLINFKGVSSDSQIKTILPLFTSAGQKIINKALKDNKAQVEKPQEDKSKPEAVKAEVEKVSTNSGSEVKAQKNTDKPESDKQDGRDVEWSGETVHLDQKTDDYLRGLSESGNDQEVIQYMNKMVADKKNSQKPEKDSPKKIQKEKEKGQNIKYKGKEVFVTEKDRQKLLKLQQDGKTEEIDKLMSKITGETSDEKEPEEQSLLSSVAETAFDYSPVGLLTNSVKDLFSSDEKEPEKSDFSKEKSGSLTSSTKQVLKAEKTDSFNPDDIIDQESLDGEKKDISGMSNGQTTDWKGKKVFISEKLRRKLAKLQQDGEQEKVDKILDKLAGIEPEEESSSMLGSLAETAFDYSPIGMVTNATKDLFSSDEKEPEKSEDGILTKAFKATPLGMVASLGSSLFGDDKEVQKAPLNKGIDKAKAIPESKVMPIKNVEALPEKGNEKSENKKDDGQTIVAPSSSSTVINNTYNQRDPFSRTPTTMGAI